MTWPQVVMLALIVLQVLHTTIKAIKDPRITSEVATLTIFLVAAWEAGIAAVLHAGGFW